MASKRDRDELVTITFRGRSTRIPVHYRTDAEVQRRYRGSGTLAGVRGGVDGFYEYGSGHIWVSLDPSHGNRRKALDHELEHALTEWRQVVWNG